MKRQFGATAVFFLLAVPIILVDRYWGAQESAGDVKVTAEVSAALIKEYEATAGNPPKSDELARLEERWIRDELMLKRAKTLGLDKGDPIIRRRLLHKMRELASLGEPPTRVELTEYYEANAAKYTRSERVDVDVVIPHDEDDVDALLARLQAGVDPGDVGRPSSFGVRQRGLTVKTLTGRLAIREAERVLSQELGVWAVYSTGTGNILLRVAQRHGSSIRPFNEVQGIILDTLDSQRRRERLDRFEDRLYRQWEPQ